MRNAKLDEWTLGVVGRVFVRGVVGTYLLLQSDDARPFLLEQLGVFGFGVWGIVDVGFSLEGCVGLCEVLGMQIFEYRLVAGGAGVAERMMSAWLWLWM